MIKRLKARLRYWFGHQEVQSHSDFLAMSEARRQEHLARYETWKNEVPAGLERYEISPEETIYVPSVYSEAERSGEIFAVSLHYLRDILLRDQAGETISEKERWIMESRPDVSVFSIDRQLRSMGLPPRDRRS